VCGRCRTEYYSVQFASSVPSLGSARFGSVLLPRSTRRLIRDSDPGKTNHRTGWLKPWTICRFIRTGQFAGLDALEPPGDASLHSSSLPLRLTAGCRPRRATRRESTAIRDNQSSNSQTRESKEPRKRRKSGSSDSQLSPIEIRTKVRLFRTLSLPTRGVCVSDALAPTHAGGLIS